MDKQAQENRKVNKGVIMWSIAAVLLVVISVLLHCYVSSDGFPVRINEIMAGNVSYPNEEGRCCDYIELYNSADHPVDLSGYQLGDISGGTRYRFVRGTVIDAGGYLVIYCDKTADDETYAPFAISRSGSEQFYLIASNDAIVDSVTTMAMDQDMPMIRKENGDWELSDTATPGFANDSQRYAGMDIYNEGVSPIRISEYSACETGYAPEYGMLCDWIELYNTANTTVDISGFVLSDNVGNDKFVFPQNTVMQAGEYRIIYCSRAGAGDIAPFGLSELGGENIVLKNDHRMVVELLETSSMETGEALALQDDGTWLRTSMPSPGYENTEAGYRQYLRQIGAEPGTVVISEVMAAEQGCLPDCFDAFPDWIELHNTSAETVSLAGWFLSDDAEEPMKWEIPGLLLQSDERAIVFCSGRDTAEEGQLHASFSLSSGGEDVLLTSYLGTTVDKITYGESRENTSYVFGMNAEVSQTAYPTPGYPNDASGYDHFSQQCRSKGALSIWEVMSSNDEYLPQALGECYDWVELRNTSDAPIDLSAYSLSDDAEDADLYTIPSKTLAPGGVHIVILSGDVDLSGTYDHAGFALDGQEDRLLLYENGNLIDHVYLRDIPVGCSYGRYESNGGFYYMQPTPKEANAPGQRMISSMPVSEMLSGVYSSDSGFSVPLQAEGAIYYTTDGSDPDTSSNLYTEPVQIRETTVLRAVAVEEGKRKSEIYTATFLVGESHDLPVVSLVTDPDNLWGARGIYKNGDMTIKEQKRPAHVSYLGDDGSFSINCEMSLHGATTVTAFDKKSFSVRFQDGYDGPLHYDVFEDGEVTSFRSLIIRTAHESTFSSQMRDTLMAHIVANNCESVMCQKYKYVALYLNGEYWGLYALRELHSEEHFASYMNVPASSVNIVRFCSDEQNSLNELYKRCANKTFLMSDENYAYAETVLDMSSIIDWIIMESYVSNFDIHGNMRYYYSAHDGLWRCGLVDVDLGMFSERGFAETATSFHHGQLVDALLQNEKFQDLMAKRLAQLLAGPMSDESMLQTIDLIAAQIRPEAAQEGERWGCSVEMWEKLVVELKDYCTGRSQAMINSLCSWVGFTEEEKTSYFGDLI